MKHCQNTKEKPKMNGMFCPRCNLHFPESHHFCMTCGSPLVGVTLENNQAPFPGTYGPAPYGPPVRSWSTTSIVLLVLGLCFLLLIGAAGIGIALLIPAVSGARAAGRNMMCVNNEKQIALAMNNYHDAKKTFPPAYSVDEDGKPLHSWRVLLLPFLDQTGLADQIRLDEPWNSEWNQRFADQMPQVYRCPSSPDFSSSSSNYSVVVGPDTLFPDLADRDPADLNRGTMMKDMNWGTSNTILVIERPNRDGVNWMRPDKETSFEEATQKDFLTKYQTPQGRCHPSGFHVAFADSAVKRLDPNDLDPKMFGQMLKSRRDTKKTERNNE
ncbi:MAG: DUF1559 domain-containing protein [Thermoguttaceae bacterium]